MAAVAVAWRQLQVVVLQAPKVKMRSVHPQQKRISIPLLITSDCMEMWISYVYKNIKYHSLNYRLGRNRTAAHRLKGMYYVHIN